MANYQKITISMHPDVRAVLDKLAEEMGGITITELIKRAVALQKFVWEHRDAELLIREGDKVTSIVLL